MSHQFNRTILREYDVRGIVGTTLHPADATALGRSYAALATSEGAKRVAVGRDGRAHSPTRSRAGRRPARGRTRCRPHRPWPLADALFRGLDARRRRRHSGHRQPQPVRLQRLQDAATAARCWFEIQDLGRRAPKATGATVRARSSMTSSTIMSMHWSRASMARVQDRLGRGQWRRRPGAREAGQAPARRAPLLYTEVDKPGFPHHPDPTVEE